MWFKVFQKKYCLCTRLNKFLVIVVCLFIHVYPGISQPLFKEKTSSNLWFGTTVELNTKKHHRFLIGGDVQRSSFAGDRLGNTPFDETNLFVGYQFFLREAWQFQLNQRRNRIVTGRKDFSQGVVQHNGKIKSLIFVKQLSIEFIQSKDNRSSADDFRFSLLTYIGKKIEIKGTIFQPGIRFEGFRNWNTVGEPRRLSKTRLWIENQIRLSNNINLVLFAMRETDYFFAEEQYGLDDNGDLVLLKPYRKLNLFTPTYGIKLRVIIHPDQAHSELPFNLFHNVNK